MHRLRRGCSKPPYCVVICSPQHGGGPRPFAGRVSPRSRLSFLGGDAWRTPTTCGRDTSVLDYFVLACYRVFYVKCELLSSNTWFLERVLQGAYCKIVYRPLYLRGLLDPSLCSKENDKQTGKNQFKECAPIPGS
jgi:hypothetical protein